jgi:shikimate dehydrogenase
VDGADEWRGLSLTMPLKREVDAAADLVRHVDRVSGAPTPCCSTPTVVARAQHRRPGAEAALSQGSVDPCGALVLGGGATATSVLLALAERG